jgi:hypothetical protein
MTIRDAPHGSLSQKAESPQVFQAVHHWPDHPVAHSQVLPNPLVFIMPAASLQGQTSCFRRAEAADGNWETVDRLSDEISRTSVFLSHFTVHSSSFHSRT